MAVLSVPVPSHTCAAIAVPLTTLSSPALPVSQRTAQGPIRVPASATMANDKVPLLARNILPPVSTPINVAILERELSHHPKCNFSNSLSNPLCFGTHVGYTGPEKNRVSRNLISTVQHPEVVSSNLTKEISLGRVAGLSLPFPYHICSAIRWAWSLKNIPQIGTPFTIYLTWRGTVLMITYLRNLMHFNMLG